MIGPQITPEQTDDYSFSSDIKNFKEKYSYKIAATTEVIELEMKVYDFMNFQKNQSFLSLYSVVLPLTQIAIGVDSLLSKFGQTQRSQILTHASAYNYKHH